MLLNRLLSHIGPCIRLNDAIRTLFARLHLIFHRSLVFNDRTLTSSILARARKRTFPTYIVSRTTVLFDHRTQLLEYEEALRIEYRMEECLGENMDTWRHQHMPTTPAARAEWREQGLRQGLKVFELAWPVWQRLVVAAEQEQQGKPSVAEPSVHCQTAYYGMRFHPGACL